MRSLGLILVVALILFSCSSSKNGGGMIEAVPVSDCTGAVPLIRPGKTLLQMPGNGGRTEEFANYPVIDEIEEINSTWLSYVAEFDGEFYLDIDAPGSEMGMIVFETDFDRDICNDIVSARAEVVRFLIEEGNEKLALDKSRRPNSLYPIKMREGDEIFMILYSNTKSKHDVYLEFDFKSDVLNTDSVLTARNQKIVDLRKEGVPGNFRIMVRDADTDLPIISNVILEGLKEVAGYYTASDLYIQPSSSGQIEIKCGSKGYFLADLEQLVRAGETGEVTVQLERLQAGKSMQIDDIQFKPGGAEFMPGAEPKLKRLKEFMILNADLKIEIQGHVMELGEDGSALGKRISTDRAKKVMQYLIDAGIDKHRMKAVGYGPIYPEPKFSYEEQANRRVEILIL